MKNVFKGIVIILVSVFVYSCTSDDDYVNPIESVDAVKIDSVFMLEILLR